MARGQKVDLQPEWYRYNTAFMASSDVKTAFDVARPAVVSKILTLTGVHGHLTAALLAEMQDVHRSASIDNSETEFRYSRCIRQGGVRVAKYVLWKAEEKWRAKRLGVMMWADNHWIFSDNREKLICMVNDIIGVLLDLGLEAKPESLSSTDKHEDMKTLSVGGRDKVWGLPFCEIFDVLGNRFHPDGKGFQGAERSICKALRSWWRVMYIYRSKTVPMTTKCKRIHGHVQHNPEWQFQFAVEWNHDPQGTCVGSPDIASHLQTWFWDGSCDNGNCGCGIVIMAYSDPHGWFTFYNKRGPVREQFLGC